MLLSPAVFIDRFHYVLADHQNFDGHLEQLLLEARPHHHQNVPAHLNLPDLCFKVSLKYGACFDTFLVVAALI